MLDEKFQPKNDPVQERIEFPVPARVRLRGRSSGSRIVRRLAWDS